MLRSLPIEGPMRELQDLHQEISDLARKTGVAVNTVPHDDDRPHPGWFLRGGTIIIQRSVQSMTGAKQYLQSVLTKDLLES